MDPKRVLISNGYKSYAATLKLYWFVDELQDMANGSFYRWVRLDDNKLTNGAFLTGVELKEEGMLLHFKINRRFFNVWSDDVLLFKKKSADEILRQKFKSYVGND